VDPLWPPFLLEPILAAAAARLALHGEGAGAAGASLPIADAQGRPSATFLEWLGTTKAGGAPSAVPETAPGAILFTSGSSGQPKGVVLSRGALVRSAQGVVTTFGWRGDDRFLNLADLHAMSGLRNTCLAPAACGAAAILTPPAERAHAFGVQACLLEHRVTVLGTGPALIRLAVKLRGRLQPEAWRAPRQVLCTGGTLAPADAAAFRAWTGRPVINYYGLTETTGLCIAHTAESAETDDGSLGRPVGAECRILDPAGRPCPPGEAGELVIAGPNLMLGYLGRPDLTAEAMRGGVFHTGDRARARADGQIELIGRLGNAIKTAQTDLLFPEEIEDALAGHPGLLDAAAVGIAGDAGDRMVAFLVLRTQVANPGRFSGEVHRFLGERLGPQRLPGAYRFLPAIPRLPSGKIDRQALLREAGHGES
jgi:acyl-coenzyme A synthetase/AMP-(fatty) acid ligase